MLITCLKELEERRTLEYNDVVYFTVGEGTIRYTVDECFLRNLETSYDNSSIFRLLKVDKYKLSEKAYGYGVKREYKSYFWPDSKNSDYPALTRLVKELYMIIEGPEEDCIPILTRWELLDL